MTSALVRTNDSHWMPGETNVVSPIRPMAQMRRRRSRCRGLLVAASVCSPLGQLMAPLASALHFQFTKRIDQRLESSGRASTLVADAVAYALLASTLIR